MTLERRIEKARNKLSSLLAYASTSLGTDRLADTDRFPTERPGPSDHSWGYQANLTDDELRRSGQPTDHFHTYGVANPLRETDKTALDEPMTTLWEWEDEQRKLKGPKE